MCVWGACVSAYLCVLAHIYKNEENAIGKSSPFQKIDLAHVLCLF